MFISNTPHIIPLTNSQFIHSRVVLLCYIKYTSLVGNFEMSKLLWQHLLSDFMWLQTLAEVCMTVCETKISVYVTQILCCFAGSGRQQRGFLGDSQHMLNFPFLVKEYEWHERDLAPSCTVASGFLIWPLPALIIHQSPLVNTSIVSKKRFHLYSTCSLFHCDQPQAGVWSDKNRLIFCQ